MQTTEVTKGQWQAVMGENPSHFRDCGETCPVEMVSWYDTQRFIARLNVMAGARTYCLPIRDKPFDHTEDIGFRLAMTP